MKKKILIISRTIFPAINPRAFRATELAKELARQEHDVTLYAVLGNYNYTAFELEYKLKVRNIGRMIFATYNSDEAIRNNLIDKVLNKLIKKHLEYPDIELMFRIPRVFQLEKNVDLLISVASPYAIHWGCALSKSLMNQSFPEIWAADCGDPYMGNPIIDHPFYFKYLEKWFCRKTNFLPVPTDNVISFYYPEFRDKIKVIPQGFKFEEIDYSKEYTPNRVPTFAYAGIFYENKRDPTLFLNYLSTLKMDFKFIIYTVSDNLIQPYYKKLEDKIDVRPFIERKQLLHELSKMDFLINIENLHSNYGSPSKLIDYAIAKRPILSITSHHLPVDIISEFFVGNYQHQFIVDNLDKYNIIQVARQFCLL